MFKDRQEALAELEQQLLQEEVPQQEPDADEPFVYRNYSNHYGRDLRNFASGYQAYNSDRTDVDAQDFSETVEREPEEKGLRGLMAAAVALLAAILGILAWWIFGLAGGM